VKSLFYGGLLCLLIVTLWLGIQPKPVIYVAPEPTPIPTPVEATTTVWTTEKIKDEISITSNKYGVDPKVVDAVVFCESSYNETALGDGGKSRGLAQIHKDYHPEITDEEAYDPEYAIDFLARNIKEGRGYLWTCARDLGFASKDML